MFNEWLCRVKFSNFIKGLLVVIGVLPLILISLISISISKSALEDSAYNQLNVSRSIKEKEVENYFIEREADTRLLSKTLSVFYQSATVKLDRFSRLKSRDIEFFLENVDKEA